MTFTKLFYYLKPLIPRNLQIFLRRKIAQYRIRKYRHIWPVNPAAGKAPEQWQGWPGGKRFAIILTHDVETKKGHDNCLKLAGIEKKLDFRSSFNLVPERYNVAAELRNRLEQMGFEIGVHGLKHDGKLYSSEKIFRERAVRINRYLSSWGAVGFRSPAMHHNLEWLHELNIIYDASTFDTDPFEPMPDGVKTIFPFWVNGRKPKQGYVELPYTLAQDFTLFIIMQEKQIGIWKDKLDWIVRNGGMALLNVHPDYINFENKSSLLEEYPVDHYEEFLKFVRHEYKNEYWHVLPREMAQFWISRLQL